MGKVPLMGKLQGKDWADEGLPEIAPVGEIRPLPTSKARDRVRGFEPVSMESPDVIDDPSLIFGMLGDTREETKLASGVDYSHEKTKELKLALQRIFVMDLIERADKNNDIVLSPSDEVRMESFAILSMGVGENISYTGKRWVNYCLIDGNTGEGDRELKVQFDKDGKVLHFLFLK